MQFNINDTWHCSYPRKYLKIRIFSSWKLRVWKDSRNLKMVKQLHSIIYILSLPQFLFPWSISLSCTYLSISPSIHIHLSTFHPSIYLSICLNQCLYQFIYLSSSIYLFIFHFPGLLLAVVIRFDWIQCLSMDLPCLSLFSWIQYLLIVRLL